MCRHEVHVAMNAAALKWARSPRGVSAGSPRGPRGIPEGSPRSPRGVPAEFPRGPREVSAVLEKKLVFGSEGRTVMQEGSEDVRSYADHADRHSRALPVCDSRFRFSRGHVCLSIVMIISRSVPRYTDRFTTRALIHTVFVACPHRRPG